MARPRGACTHRIFDKRTHLRTHRRGWLNHKSPYTPNLLRFRETSVLHTVDTAADARGVIMIHGDRP